MSYSHTFTTVTSSAELGEQEIVLTEDYEQHRDDIETARELAIQAIDSGLVGDLAENDAYSAYVSGHKDENTGSFSLNVNRVPAPVQGPNAPAAEVAQPAAVPDEPGETAEQAAAGAAAPEETADNPDQGETRYAGGTPDSTI